MMRFISGGESGQAILWDFSQSESAYRKIYEVSSSTAQTNGLPKRWVSATWSSDGSCIAGARDKSTGVVTLTHIKKVRNQTWAESVLYMLK